MIRGRSLHGRATPVARQRGRRRPGGRRLEIVAAEIAHDRHGKNPKRNIDCRAGVDNGNLKSSLVSPTAKVQRTERVAEREERIDLADAVDRGSVGVLGKHDGNNVARAVYRVLVRRVRRRNRNDGGSRLENGDVNDAVAAATLQVVVHRVVHAILVVTETESGSVNNVAALWNQSARGLKRPCAIRGCRRNSARSRNDSNARRDCVSVSIRGIKENRYGLPLLDDDRNWRTWDREHGRLQSCLQLEANIPAQRRPIHRTVRDNAVVKVHENIEARVGSVQSGVHVRRDLRLRSGVVPYAYLVNVPL
eukprot:Opistho-1_new@43818